MKESTTQLNNFKRVSVHIRIFSVYLSSGFTIHAISSPQTHFSNAMHTRVFLPIPTPFQMNMTNKDKGSEEDMGIRRGPGMGLELGGENGCEGMICWLK